LIQSEGVSAGVENTNYFVDTTDNCFVLTLFENVGFDDLPFFIALNQHLITSDIPCPAPIADYQNNCLHRLKDKPTVLWQRLPGKSIMDVETHHSQSIGSLLAQFHLSTQNFPEHRQDPRGPHWWKEALGELKEKLTPEEQHLIENEIESYNDATWKALPRGTIHTDCFRDNVLFVNDEITGLLDLYNACYGPYLYDLAVCVNDWCSENGQLNLERTKILIDAYQKIRPISPEEKEAWPQMLRSAALRFWLSRLLDKHFPKKCILC